MNIECLGCINWVKVSEIIFEGFVIGLTVVGAYYLGIRQSNQNWKRELNQREREIKIENEKEMDLLRIDALSEIRRFLSRFSFQMVRCFESKSDGEKCIQDMKELLIILDKYNHLFSIEEEENIYRTLDELNDKTIEMGSALWDYLNRKMPSEDDTSINEKFEIYSDLILSNSIALEMESKELVEAFTNRF